MSEAKVIPCSSFKLFCIIAKKHKIADLKCNKFSLDCNCYGQPCAFNFSQPRRYDMSNYVYWKLRTDWKTVTIVSSIVV
ncbi:CLUMA_CG001483, isoform A [Clunio marinus]|uniref:CLUMA_CG001483, isoform A n=1 Tax=Clunio marinus TaxID=568069 RepID=A0A1J1HJV5_9DIPT|nr:CLUMA_CG001483, isoform A [Clunio marinus]